MNGPLQFLQSSFIVHFQIPPDIALSNHFDRNCADSFVGACLRKRRHWILKIDRQQSTQVQHVKWLVATMPVNMRWQLLNRALNVLQIDLRLYTIPIVRPSQTDFRIEINGGSQTPCRRFFASQSRFLMKSTAPKFATPNFTLNAHQCPSIY